uniref:NADH-ubiquinone oxidoreductase chain 1 n=1 Tax=Cucujoidea sp. 34 KM-2017 TaxID=2219372 RepID=A0A346RHQ6_9CUCU|nr:NADH dehydrogenase subunit 1 [Cucujoidea sp. 34 KM-2017]
MIVIESVLICLSLMILLICVLVGVAFLTLLERKVLGYIQYRKGPNKTGILGLAQPFSDAIKLFTKEQNNPLSSNFILFYFSPLMMFFLSLLVWVVIPFLGSMLSLSFSLLLFLSISMMNVYGVMMAGWASDSNYSMLGSLRVIAQSISYEVSMTLLLMSVFILVLSFNLVDLIEFQEFVWFVSFLFPFLIMWLVISFAESNRTPFDFVEGESELVSGFNVEYSSGGFAMIFLAEYSGILFLSFFSVLMFLCGGLNFNFFVKLVFISFFWIWVRGSLPRYRYDKLMYLAWQSYLPISLNIYFLMVILKLFVSILIS